MTQQKEKDHEHKDGSIETTQAKTQRKKEWGQGDEEQSIWELRDNIK